MKLKLLPALIILFLATGALAQAPNGVHVMVPNGNNYIQSTATSGSLTSGGITVTWDVQANSATVNFQGNYSTQWIDPYFDIYWFSSPEDLPFSGQVVCNSPSGNYDFSLPFKPVGEDWNHLHDNFDHSGDLDFGTYLPACSRFDFTAEVIQEGVDYDITMNLEWGTGVDTQDETLDMIKALYR
jgi:hypothetical protein